MLLGAKFFMLRLLVCCCYSVVQDWFTGVSDGWFIGWFVDEVYPHYRYVMVALVGPLQFSLSRETCFNIGGCWNLCMGLRGFA